VTRVLDGRAVLVTGAGGGLGAAAVAAAAVAGARLVLVDRHEERLAQLAAQHGDAVAATHALDLTDPAALQQLVESVSLRPTVDCVWHLVGGWRGGEPLDQAPLDDWAALYEPLVATTVALTRAFAAPLSRRPDGRFLIVSSPQAAAPTTTNAAYATAKAGAEAAVLALAHHFHHVGSSATANVVVVPAIVTAAMRDQRPDRPWRVHVRAEDLAATLVFASSQAAAKMNGQHLSLFDGSPS